MHGVRAAFPLPYTPRRCLTRRPSPPPPPDQELIGSSCPRVRAPSPLEFARDFVHQNRPCIITGAMDDWPAMSKWTDDYLLSKLAGIEVSINVTPNGRGDAVAREPSGKEEEEKGAAGSGREVST